MLTSLRTLSLAAAVLVAASAGAAAQSWPTRSVQTISTVSAGNAGDIVARVVLDQVGRQIGQSFVLENRPGALNFASAGIGSASHWAAERLRLAAGIDVQHIPFRGPVEAFTEVMTGRVDFYYLPIAPALPNIRDGKVVALAVSTPKRAPALPDVPTVAEAGYPEAEYLFWGGLALPAKAPRAIVDRLHEETRKAQNVPAIQERLATFGVQPMPMSVDQFDKFYRDDVAATAKLAKDINLVPTN